MHQLLTLPFSHYNEKARWGLDLARVRYVERRYMPLLHTAPALGVSLRHGFKAGDKVGSPFSLPALLLDDGRAIRDSGDILKFASECAAPGPGRLFPADHVEEVTALERRFSRRLGPASRCAAYNEILDDHALLARVGEHNVGRLQARAFRGLTGVFERVLRRSGINSESAAAALKVCRQEMQEVGEMIADRRYLVGDEFSAADLSFATMAVPILLVSEAEGYGAWLPPVDEVPPSFAAIIREMRETPAGKFALRIYRDHRRPR